MLNKGLGTGSWKTHHLPNNPKSGPYLFMPPTMTHSYSAIPARIGGLLVFLVTPWSC